MRPQAPYRASDILLSLSGRRKVGVVVDLGSGTGLSTRMWKGRAHRVYGIEPNDDMRAVAVRVNPGVEFIKASSYATTLPDSFADIVVCSQSFHWMDPIASLREIDRVLLPGGLFAILDCDWPVTAGIEAELAYERFFSCPKDVRRISDDRRAKAPVKARVVVAVPTTTTLRANARRLTDRLEPSLERPTNRFEAR